MELNFLSQSVKSTRSWSLGLPEGGGNEPASSITSCHPPKPSMASGHPEVGRPRAGYSCQHHRDALACSANTRPLADVIVTVAPEKSEGCNV